LIVLDTTVLIYAVGAPHPLRERCRQLFGAVVDGAIAATTTAPVIQEFAHVRARRRGRADAAASARDFGRLLSPLLPTDETALQRALRLFQSNERLGAFDAFLAAAAIEAGADALVSADRAFAGVRGLRHVDPATPALDALLARRA
jgi:uncharacterized protein